MRSPSRKAELALMPPVYDFAWPMLCAIRKLGNTTRDRLESAAFEQMGLSAEQLRIYKPDKTQREASNRAWWAVTYLKWARLVEDPETSGGYRLTKWSRELFSGTTPEAERRAYVTGAVWGALRTEEGIQTKRIKAPNRR